MIQSALDEQEQQMKIAKIRADIKDAERQTAEPVEIAFVGQAEEAAK